MNSFQIHPVGHVVNNPDGVAIQLNEEIIPALQGLEGFSHLQVLWWADEFDTDEARNVLETPQPYKSGPEVLGIFATRSPLRPNPIGLTVVQPLGIDQVKGLIRLPYIDAHDKTPVLDIKPYTPSGDRVQTPRVPGWCAHWPKSLEQSEDFDWEAEFTF